MFTAMPYFLVQITHNLIGIALILKQGLLLLLLLRWQSKRWRSLLVIWLSIEVLLALLMLGARTEVVLLLLSAALLYHRLVRPLPLWRTMVGGGICLGGFLLFGIARDIDMDLQSQVMSFTSEPLSFLTMPNEFQSLFGTAYDLYLRKSDGSLGQVPWQIYFSDLYMIIPSQLLPFYKWDPSQWYLDLIGYRDTGVGFMFGVVSQAVIGLDWVELALRGTLLGWLFARIHRWYMRHNSGFWPTLFYLFLCVWSYYTFRSTTFHFISFIVHRFAPTVFLVCFCSTLLRGPNHSTPVKEL